MADIELMIKIPDHLYKLLKDFPSDSNETTIENVLMKAVENGTPIPKGHGRLIDADYILNKMETTDAQPVTYAENYAFDFAKTMFREAPTIIEADKESEDKT